MWEGRYAGAALRAMKDRNGVQHCTKLVANKYFRLASAAKRAQSCSRLEKKIQGWCNYNVNIEKTITLSMISLACSLILLSLLHIEVVSYKLYVDWQLFVVSRYFSLT